MIIDLLVLGAVIGANNLATALALGALGQAHRRWRIVGVFALFEFVVPLIGIWLGGRVASSLEARWGWLGPALIALVGIWTLVTIATGGDEQRLARRVASWSGLFVLAATLSVDNLVIGFSLGLGRRSPLLVASVIALFSASFAWIGLNAGRAARREWHQRAAIGSGVLLLVLAVATGLGWV